MAVVGVGLFAPQCWPVIVLAPVLLYNFWILHALKSRKPEYVLYAYIQLVRESAALLGFARGVMAGSEKKRTVGSYATRNAKQQK